ncbi:GGDEF domain-containing protein, partial [Klebsiella pneumoniae]
MIIDLDNFKPINDNFGHSEGNEVLCNFADMLE